jgi:phosphatidate cytidylyltransferase
MRLFADPAVTRVVAGMAGILTIATAIGQVLRFRARSEPTRAAIANVNARILSWWVMSAVVLGSLFVGRIASITLFGLISFLALREFVTLTPTRRADHRVLLLAFFAAIPLQYASIALDVYAAFAFVVPVAGILGVSLVLALAGDTHRFTERTAQIYLALMLCVYAVSHAPAVLMLHIPGGAGQNAKLLLFLLIVVESSDVLQYLWGKALGRRAIAPTVSPNKTVEGFIGGIGTATLLGCVLAPLTPFSPWQAAAVSLVITTAGFAGGLVMSAIKRDHGVKDFGTVIGGHGGVLDRIDSLCFAGPVLFHVTRTFVAS